MKVFALLITVLMLFSACGAGAASDAISSEPPVSAVSSSDASLAAEQAAADKAAAQQAAAEQAAADKAAAEQAAADKAAAEQAATEQAAAQQAAAEQAAAEQAAAEKAAAEKAAAEQKETKTTKAVTGTNFLGSVEKSIIAKINEERTSLGLGSLTYDENLRSAARIRSRELYKSGTFAHQRPNGDGWETVLKDDVPIRFLAAGENLCMTEYNDPNLNYATSASFWFNEWVNSPSHYENMIKSNYTHVGVGVYCIEKDGMIYAYATTTFAEF